MVHATFAATPRAQSTAHRLPENEAVAAAFSTQLGWMAIAHADTVICGVVFGHATQRQAIDSLRRHLRRRGTEVVDVLEIEKQPQVIVDVIELLSAYAAGEPVDFSKVQVDERHLTDFGRRIVKTCRKIPRGKTRSYGELAKACGSPGAARAVGQVMAKNCYPLIVPCHRVLAASGKLGGFSAPQGLAMKRRLLELEVESRFDR
jgi:methylated-DNA-[protein]-cysteine S-methyltransferase